jgi:hypothetical protein
MVVKQKLAKFVTKVARKFRRGDNEKGFIGAGSGAVLIALGSTGYLGNTINSMVSSLAGGAGSGASSGTTSSGGAASGIAGFVNDVVVLIGIISVILGIVEYRRLRKQIFK